MSNKSYDCGWEKLTTSPPFPGIAHAATGGPHGSTYGKAHAFEADLDVVLDRIRELLVEKNTAYGDSALNPLRFHSSASPVEQLNVRMDDKLSRMARGGKSGEDEPLDYVGYWVLREIAKLREAGVRQ